MRHLNKDLLEEFLIHRTEADMASERVYAAALSVWQDGEEVFLTTLATQTRKPCSVWHQ